MNDDITLDESQQRAVELACTASIGIVTGGPGTGKSTCLRYALDRLDAAQQTYELAAPTGKAARRLTETTGRNARTIHRLLEFHPRYGWQRNADRPLECSVVVVDESSMIDIELGAALLAAIDEDCTRLILIGDADQLPPVGPGRLFGDLVDSGDVPTVRLQHLHRSERESWVAVNAPRVLLGQMPDVRASRDFKFCVVDDAKQILQQVVHLVSEVFPQRIDAAVQVLIPQRPGAAGIDAANNALQRAINPRGEGAPVLTRKGFELRLGDRVIQTRNDYLLGVFNGEIGDVLEIDSAEVVVQFEGHDELVRYKHDRASALQLAYALTVHRAQGSEFPWTIVVAHSTHSFILSRQLLYTAITRGKQGVVIVGDEKGMRRALKERTTDARHTALIERLRGELEDPSVVESENIAV
jgi:exodeoxyribonuclease V alpha subunit